MKVAKIMRGPWRPGSLARIAGVVAISLLAQIVVRFGLSLWRSAHYAGSPVEFFLIPETRAVFLRDVGTICVLHLVILVAALAWMLLSLPGSRGHRDESGVK